MFLPLKLLDSVRTIYIVCRSIYITSIDAEFTMASTVAIDELSIRQSHVNWLCVAQCTCMLRVFLCDKSFDKAFETSE